MAHYPHLLSADSEVWDKFLEAEGHRLKEVWYDVHVGGAVESGAEADSVLGRVAAGVSRKRIDVVVRVGAGYWVVEVKPVADMGALGQVVTYARLFEEEYRPDGEVWPVVVCDKADSDVIKGFVEAGVGVFVND
jgi:hypothetical protein